MELVLYSLTVTNNETVIKLPTFYGHDVLSCKRSIEIYTCRVSKMGLKCKVASTVFGTQEEFSKHFVLST